MSRKEDLDPDSLNLAHWTAVSAHHQTSPFYPVEDVVLGASTLSPIEVDWLGSLASLRGLHLQCGIGLETISLARMGARMTAIDYADSAIQTASALANRANLAIDFRVTNVLIFEPSFESSFDFVYASHGVLRWISDLTSWMTNVSRYLKPSGKLFIFDVHPLTFRLCDINDGKFILSGSYFSTSGTAKHIHRTHAMDSMDSMDAASSRVVHFDWPIHEILQTVIDAGLTLRRYRDLPVSSYDRHGLMTRCGPNEFHPKGAPVSIPLSFALLAEKALCPSDHVRSGK